jgi:FeS assembly protein IscX
MKWTDSLDIAMALSEAHPGIDPARVLFVDLRQWVLDLPGFDDDPKRSGEKILEAIQQAWIDESDFEED